MSKKLTPRQKKFADNYIESGNATQSAIKAVTVRKRRV
ncbi:Terminase small subunit [Pediococcus pentosaceus]|nr:Terminase small subunit [Pediococcus pentosaceus]